MMWRGVRSVVLLLLLAGSAQAQDPQGNVYGDPQFVDPANGDFRLKPGSPAIGAGIPIADITTDADGKPRSSTRPTIGAYEFADISVPPPPPPPDPLPLVLTASVTVTQCEFRLEAQPPTAELGVWRAQFKRGLVTPINIGNVIATPTFVRKTKLAVGVYHFFVSWRHIYTGQVLQSTVLPLGCQTLP